MEIWDVRLAVNNLEHFEVIGDLVVQKGENLRSGVSGAGSAREEELYGLVMFHFLGAMVSLPLFHQIYLQNFDKEEET